MELTGAPRVVLLTLMILCAIRSSFAGRDRDGKVKCRQLHNDDVALPPLPMLTPSDTMGSVQLW
jgi:hypothetical protein